MQGWRAAALNQGWTYRHRVQPAEAGQAALELLVQRWQHSDRALGRSGFQPVNAN